MTEDNVQSLLPAANLLQLTDVRDACCEFLQSQLHPTNCLGIRAFADLHGCLELLTSTESYIERHFTEVRHNIQTTQSLNTLSRFWNVTSFMA